MDEGVDLLRMCYEVWRAEQGRMVAAHSSRLASFLSVRTGRSSRDSMYDWTRDIRDSEEDDTVMESVWLREKAEASKAKWKKELNQSNIVAQHRVTQKVVRERKERQEYIQQIDALLAERRAREIEAQRLFAEHQKALRAEALCYAGKKSRARLGIQNVPWHVGGTPLLPLENRSHASTDHTVSKASHRQTVVIVAPEPDH